MKNRSGRVLVSLALLGLLNAAFDVVPAIWQRVDARQTAAAPAAERLLFSELPPPGTPEKPAALNARPAVAADGDDTILLAASRRIWPLDLDGNLGQGLAEPYGPSFPGNFTVAAGNVWPPQLNLVTVPRQPGFPVKLFTFQGMQGFLQSGQGYLPGYWYSTIGNFLGDGRKQFAFAPGPGVASPVVFVDDNGNFLSNVEPFPGWTGGITIATLPSPIGGDDWLLVGKATGSTEVAVLRPNPSFGSGPRTFSVAGKGFAFDPASTGGVHVATGDLNNDGVADIVTSSENRVRAFQYYPAVARLKDFLAFANYSGEVPLIVATLGGRKTIVAGTGPGVGFRQLGIQFDALGPFNIYRNTRPLGTEFSDGGHFASFSGGMAR